MSDDLPADYFTAAGKKAQFPVIELLAGFPGGPDTWIHPLRIGPILDTEIAAGRMAPTIVVMPVQNVSAWQDSECVTTSGPSRRPDRALPRRAPSGRAGEGRRRSGCSVINPNRWELLGSPLAP